MWDERFSGNEYLFGTEPAEALVRLKDRLIARGRTLLVADGEGRNSVFLAQQGFDVLATDNSLIGLEKARKLASDAGVAVEYRHEDIYRTDWASEAFDNVVAIFIQFVPPEKQAQIFAGLKTALRPGGVLLLHGYTPEQVAFGTGGPSNPEHMYTQQLLSDSFSDMNVTLNSSYHADISEGRGHHGRSALIDFVAIK